VRAATAARAPKTTAGSPTSKAKTRAPTGKGKAGAPTTAVHPPKVPGLRISITDGRTTAQVGERLGYAVLVQNSGAHASPRLKITQSLPPGLRFVSASRHGAARAGNVTWYADLPAGGKDRFSVQAQVTQQAVRQPRLAAVACAALAGSSTPIICAAHLDRLPGVPAAAPGHRAVPPASVLMPGYAPGILAAVVVGALAVLTGLRLRVRRRRRAG
jgi:uncharacterized repeat protein (TIGR01451 family)